MAFLDDVVDLIADEVSHIGLSEDGATEYSGTGYEHQVPTYPAASDESTDISSTLEFDGDANDGPITHLIYKRSGSPWVFRPVDSPESFNSDGRLDVASAEINSDFLA